VQLEDKDRARIQSRVAPKVVYVVHARSETETLMAAQARAIHMGK